MGGIRKERAACRANELEWLAYTRIRSYETMKENEKRKTKRLPLAQCQNRRGVAAYRMIQVALSATKTTNIFGIFPGIWSSRLE